jgi:SAM-dependent methyltransferase
MCGPPPATGQRQRFPARFLHNLQRVYPTDGQRVLHLFAGSSDLGDTVDIRSGSSPTFVAPYDDLPIADSTYDMVIADPPYTVGFAQEWVSSLDDVPRPKRILGEAARIVRPGGLILILHVIVIPAYKVFGVERVALHPVLCGPNNAIRVLNVFRKALGEET